MKSVQLFEEFVESKVEKLTAEQKEFLTKCVKGKRSRNPDGSYDVNGDVKIGWNMTRDKTLKLPIKFGRVTGNFNMVGGGHKLYESLEGCPREVLGHFVIFGLSHLKSLEHSPEIVGGTYNASHCELIKDLRGITQKIGGDLSISGCAALVSLEGCPKIINKDFDASHLWLLKTLEHGPEIVKGDMNLHQNNLESLEGAPKSVGRLNLKECRKLKSLKFIPKMEKVIGYRDNDLISHEEDVIISNDDLLDLWIKKGWPPAKEFLANHRGMLKGEKFGF